MLDTKYSVRHPQFQGKGGAVILPDAITSEPVAKNRLSVDKADLTNNELLHRQVDAMRTKDALNTDANSMKVFKWTQPWTVFSNLAARRKTRQAANAFQDIQDGCDREFADREWAAKGNGDRSSIDKSSRHASQPTRSSK